MNKYNEMDHLKQEKRNYNMLSGVLSELISDTIMNNCDGMLQVNCSKDSYSAVKLSPLLESIIQKDGTYTELCKLLFFNAVSTDNNSSYDYFIRRGMEAERIFIRRIRIHHESKQYDMYFMFIPCRVGDLAIVILLPATATGDWSSLENSRTFSEDDTFFYSMFVNLDKDECYQPRFSSIMHGEQVNDPGFRYSEWQELFATNVLQDFLPVFREKTNPSAIRYALNKNNRYHFDVLLYNRKRECICTRHALFKVRNDESDALTFFYMIQDLDSSKKEQMLQMYTPSGQDTVIGDTVKNPGYSFKGSGIAATILNHVENEIQTHYMKPLSLNQLAARYYINSAYLGQLFIRRYGMPFHKYLTKQRMEEAARLLTETNDSIQQIAKKTGLPHTNYFNRVFREYHHCSPMEYRKEKIKNPENNVNY